MSPHCFGNEDSRNYEWKPGRSPSRFQPKPGTERSTQPVSMDGKAKALPDATPGPVEDDAMRKRHTRPLPLRLALSESPYDGAKGVFWMSWSCCRNRPNRATTKPNPINASPVRIQARKVRSAARKSRQPALCPISAGASMELSRRGPADQYARGTLVGTRATLPAQAGSGPPRKESLKRHGAARSANFATNSTRTMKLR